MSRRKSKKSEPVRLAVIGGSGLYQLEGAKDVKEVRVKTPFGDPSDALILADVAGVRVAFLPRHGRGHRLLPGEVPSRANVWALKSLGVERIVSVSAVGSLKEELAPRHFAFPDQLADETKGRPSTFFGKGVVAHVAFAHPFCADMASLLHDETLAAGIVAHAGGTYCCMEGPLFSTKAESLMHRRLGYSIIGMTATPEAKLAREAEICYQPVALVTDYDCWKEDDHVSTEKVVEHLMANVGNARRLLAAALPKLAALPRRCPCATALKGAVFTDPKAMDPKTKRTLWPLIGKYLS